MSSTSNEVIKGTTRINIKDKKNLYFISWFESRETKKSEVNEIGQTSEWRTMSLGTPTNIEIVYMTDTEIEEEVSKPDKYEVHELYTITKSRDLVSILLIDTIFKEDVLLYKNKEGKNEYNHRKNNNERLRILSEILTIYLNTEDLNVYRKFNSLLGYFTRYMIEDKT